MKYLGYMAIPLDFLLGNIHLVYAVYPASVEWYTSDVGEFARILMWVSVARFWIRSDAAENWTVNIHLFFVALDLVFVINGTMYGLDSSWLILLESFAIFILQLYFKIYVRTSGKEN